MVGTARPTDNEDVHVTDQTSVLDWTQLRDITLHDDELMREVLTTLLDDTAKQIALLDQAITSQDHQKTMRLAHYCKGACANVGANAAAAVLRRLEQQAAHQSFEACVVSLHNLAEEMERLRVEVVET